MYVIITCKYEKGPIKKSREKVETSFSHYKPMGIFSDAQGQLTPKSVVQSGRNSNSSKLFMHIIIACKYEKDLMKNSGEKVETPFSPLQPYGSFLLPWKPEF